MKKKYLFPIAIFGIILLASLFLVTNSPAKESTNYVTPGHYYENGTVITDDGNIWGYQTEMDDCSVHVIFNDNGTVDNIYDDIIIDLIKKGE